MCSTGSGARNGSSTELAADGVAPPAPATPVGSAGAAPRGAPGVGGFGSLCAISMIHRTPGGWSMSTLGPMALVVRPEPTPNPNAMRLALPSAMLGDRPRTYSAGTPSPDAPWAGRILAIPGVVS